MDLQTYYEYGYGGDSFLKMACPTIRDMVRILKKENGPRVSAYYTHSPEMLLHLVGVRAFKDSKSLRANNYKEMSNRKWKCSNLDPFGSNFAAVLYSGKKVKFFINERLIELGACGGGVCNLDDLEKHFSHCF